MERTERFSTGRFGPELISSQRADRRRIDTAEFPEAVAAGWSRRRFLTGTTAAAALAFTVGTPRRSEAVVVDDPLPYPYTLGIASGDPLPDAVVIWTRLAPRPLEPYGGMPRASWRVEWEVAEDPQFSRRVLRGRTLAHPEYYHSVHVDVRGLRPGRVYYYRFKAGGQVSETGRTKTAPALDADPTKIDFAVASCQSFPDGYYTALRHIAEEELDVVLFLGDYVYETGVSSDGGLHQVPEPLPPEFAADTITLERYRLQYSLYKSEPDLIAAHRNAPWIATWDDHEVTSNYVSLDSDSWNQPIDFAVQRANAYRAYWEHMPLRLPEPDGPDLKLYRRFHYGRLAQFDVIDTRQYRDDQAPGSGDSAIRRDPSRTVLGSAQEQWLLDGLAASSARWNVLPQQIPMAQLDSAGGAALSLNMDAWDGYVPARQRILDAVREQQLDNFVVLTGDAHTNYALQLLENFDDLDSAPIGVELVGTSISSDRDGADITPALQTRLVENPHLKFANQQRGYLRCQLTPEALTTDFKIVPYVTRRDAPISVRQRIVVESGNPELILDSNPEA